MCVPLRELFAQFDIIALTSYWSDFSKAIVLASCLRGKARTILENISNIENLNYKELRAEL